jgi:acyl-ACP thioesterase
VSGPTAAWRIGAAVERRADVSEQVEFSELVGRPETGRIFERKMRPGLADVNGAERARLDAIARWLQDVAYLDLVDAGFPQRGAWIVRRARMRVDSFPRFGEALTLTTFCSGLGRFAAERRTTIRGGDASVETVALWIYLDEESWRPLRLPDDFIDLYSPSTGGRPAPVRLRHPEPPIDVEKGAWSFRVTDLDIAGHVNNSHYWGPLESDFASSTEPRGIDAEIEYREPAEVGEVAVLRSRSGMWIAGASGQLHASIIS